MSLFDVQLIQNVIKEQKVFVKGPCIGAGFSSINYLLHCDISPMVRKEEEEVIERRGRVENDCLSIGSF